jgi:hypothetical protein
VVGTGLGGGSGTLSMVVGGCSIRGTGTDSMGKSAIMGRLGARQEVSVHAPSQPAITAQALKAMPMGPRRTHITRTIPIVTYRRVKRMDDIILRRQRTYVYKEIYSWLISQL